MGFILGDGKLNLSEGTPATVGERIKTVRGSRNQKQFADSLGSSVQTIGRVERNERPAGIDLAADICRQYQIDANWLLLGLGRMRVRFNQGDNPALAARSEDQSEYVAAPEIRDDFVMIRRFDIQASAGPGAFSDQENVVDYMAFREEWVRRELRVDPSKLVLIRAVGDSMEPTIRSGDLLLVDTGIAQFVDDAIYVVVLDGALMVKRIQRFFGGGVVVRSDNPAYVEQTLSPEEAEAVSVAGRVRWIGRLI